MRAIQTYPSKINGHVNISGSKNAALAIIVGALLNSKKTTLLNVPQISDIDNLLAVVKKIVLVKKCHNKVIILGKANYQELKFEQIKEFRASYYFMGLFLGLFKEVKIYAPGGCKIGSRPINYHLDGFLKAGVEVLENSSVIHLKAKKLNPFWYKLPKKSLGATVNLILLASKIAGVSVIENASTEPEIDDLLMFLNKLGVLVFRYRNKIFIRGENEISKKISYRIMPDRIEAFTFVCLASFSKRLVIKKINTSHLIEPLKLLKESGLSMKIRKNKITVCKSVLSPVQVVNGDYPLISTDQMPLLYPVFMRVLGISKFEENIFENRFSVINELLKTNANIQIDNNKIIIEGSKESIGGDFVACDLRAAATLLIEAIANGNSTVSNLQFLERGYENIYKKIRKIGVKFTLE